MNPETRATLAELIAAHLDGGLDNSQREQLNQILKSNPDARAAYLSALRQDILLGEVLRERAESAAPAARAANGRLPVAHSRRAWWLVAGAAAALVALVFFLSKPPQKIEPTEVAIAIVESAGADAKLIRGGATVSPASGSKLLSNDRLESGSNAPISIRYPDGTSVSLSERTAATFSAYGATSAGKKIVLENGSLSADASPQPAASPMELSTPDALATVIGTRFTFSVGGGQSTLEVQHGVVRLATVSGDDQMAVDVKAGFRGVVSQFATTIDMRPIAEQKPPVAPPITHGPEVLLVTAARIPFYEHDVAIKAILEEMEFTVIEKLYSEVTSDDAKGKVLLVIPSHMCKGTRVFSDSPVPAMCWHAVWYEDLGMIDPSRSRSEALKPQWIHVTEQIPSTVASFPNGPNMRLGLYASGIPGGAAKLFVTLNDQSKRAAFFGYEKGEAMYGFTAPARRAGFSIDVREYDGQDAPVNAGKQLLMAAVKWCLGKDAKAGD